VDRGAQQESRPGRHGAGLQGRPRLASGAGADQGSAFPRAHDFSSLADFTDDEASLNLEWERLRLSIPIKVNTAEQALANIAASIDGTWRTYAFAARYMLEAKKDYNTGLKYIDQSLALKEDWLNLWIKASLLAAKGNYKDAHALAEKAYQLGQKAEFFFFEADVKKALSEWKKKL